MTRRALLTLLAQLRYPGTSYRHYDRCLPDYLRRLAAAALSRREERLRTASTADGMKAYQAWARETFWKLVGGQPERTPLAVRTVGQFERGGYRVEKIVYESQPGLYVPANVYIPAVGRPPYPGVLFQMGHSLNGKAADTYQRCCQGLAKLGYLVLAFDPMGQGERVYYPQDDLKRTRLASADAEHTLPGKQMLLYGLTATRMQAWDAVRSLDVLASHPLVDPKRLATTGQSGGGTTSMFLLCADDRLSAAAVSSGNTENFACPGFHPPGSTDDAEQNFAYSGRQGFDRWDLLYPFAPKPLLVTVSDRDFFGTYSTDYIEDGWREFQRMRGFYERAGAGEKIAWAATPLPHGLSYQLRLEIYRWFRQWMQPGTPEVAAEPMVAPEPDEVLWAAPSGNVVRSFSSQTPWSLTRALEVERAPAPLDRLVGARPPADSLRATTLRKVPSTGAAIEAIEVQSDAEVWCPAWLFIPPPEAPRGPALLLAESGGRNGAWQENGFYHALAALGFLVCAADVRGTGDLFPEAGPGNPRYARSHQDEENYAWASLILGSPLVGQRVTDLLALAQGLRMHPDAAGRPLLLAAQGRLTVPAQIAAALDPGIASVYLAGGLDSFRSVIAREEPNQPFANFVPRFLMHTDLPEVTRAIAPRPVLLAGVVDGSSRQLPPDAVRAAYAGAAHVRVLTDARWDLERFADWARTAPKA